MIKKIHIENYKSVQSLDMGLGRFNVLIGENGCGKTNILEAIVLGSAAIEYKLDNEFLATRGIRVIEPNLMKSGFDKDNSGQGIRVGFFDDLGDIGLLLNNEATFQGKDLKVQGVEIDGHTDNPQKLYDAKDKDSAILLALVKYKEKFAQNSHLFPFLIFAPENYFLRRFEEEGQIRPLGIRGEGLFRHLLELYKNEPKLFSEIKENLELIDWFDGLEIPNDLMFSEKRINLKDRFLDEDLAYIDQRSANEGFLYLLFYFTLFISDRTPKFFAIDNIDNALNPKLCSKLIEVLVGLAKKHDKQVIFTTHNPAILDGLNLHDREQKLFVISRNKLGHSKSLPIEKKPTPKGGTPIKLSEQFLRGYIGGLPKNFSYSFL